MSVSAPPSNGLLFTPISFRGLLLKNRVMVSPMSTYRSHEGFVDDFHLVHLGRFAMGGVGLVMMEATAVTRDGRSTPGCNGIWLDAHVHGLKRIVDFLHSQGTAAGIQLAHTGPKGSSQRPWHGMGPLREQDAFQRREFTWPVFAASDRPFDDGWPVPQALTRAQMDELLDDYRRATRRAAQAGFDVIEVHAAHGYLLHSFLSPLTNARNDDYGGSLENRMRFPLEVFEAVRSEFPSDKPVFVRISCVDGVSIGWSIEDSVAFAKALQERGVDAIACSTGGVKLPKDQVLVSRTLGFQVPFAEQVRRNSDVPTIAVGMILQAEHGEEILEKGQADLIAIGRELLFNPNWAAQASIEMKGPAGWQDWPEEFGWWLERRARQLVPKKPDSTAS